MNTKKTFIKKSFMPTNIMFYVLHVNTKTYWGSYNYFIDPLDKSLFFIRKELKNLRVAGNLQNTILPHINSTLITRGSIGDPVFLNSWNQESVDL